jgi:nucleoside-diphosphate-sugar epimerase
LQAGATGPDRQAVRMSRRILITGGAGFIGAPLADQLLSRACEVRVLDSLVTQVHDDNEPEYLHSNVELVRGDLRVMNQSCGAHCAASMRSIFSPRPSASARQLVRYRGVIS